MSEVLPRLTGAALVAFHDGVSTVASDPPWQDVAENHLANSRLWEEEDLARRRSAPDAEIVANKRAIDELNQRRNDAVERIDDAILHALAALLREDARLHAETAGMMIDRLSILSLKIRAMHAQTQRTDANESHRAACVAKLERLREQRGDLARCFDELLQACAAGTARYKVYRQFKMYNDPAMNPYLAGSPPARG